MALEIGKNKDSLLYGVLNLKDNYHQREAISEAKIVYETFKNEKSRDMLSEHILKDLQERPMYYIEGVIATQGFAKVVLRSAPKELLYKSAIVSAKIGNSIHKLIENNREFYDFIDNVLKKSNTSINDISNILNSGIEFPLMELKKNNLNDTLNHYFGNMQKFSNNPALTLDLNSDGEISTTNLDNGVYFDHNSDGVAFKTTWI